MRHSGTEADRGWEQLALLAAAWSAEAERALDLLPRTRRTRVLRHGERVAHRPGLEQTASGDYFRSSRDGTSILGPEQCPGTSRSPSSASVVVVGGMADRHMRQRSFYLDAPVPLALALHERPRQRAASGLLKGVRIQRLAHGRLPARVPGILESRTLQFGSRRPWWRSSPRAEGLGTADVVVEEWLPGRPLRVDEEGVEHELLAVVAALWELEETTTLEVPAKVRARVGERFAALVRSDPRLRLWPQGVDAADLGSRVARLVDTPLRVTSGVSHGDPGLGNALRTDEGGLVLVDWEDAGHRVLSHDVLKVLGSASVPPESWSGQHPRVPTADPRVLPSDQQLAVALLQFLAGWEERTDRARRRRSVQAHRRRLRRQLAALDGLLA